MSSCQVITGNVEDVIDQIADDSIQCIVTSPPYYGLRKYGVGSDLGEIGNEPLPSQYIQRLVKIFGRLRSKLKADGTVWLNLGDSYARQGGSAGFRGQFYGNDRRQQMLRIPQEYGLKPKDLLGIPWRVALALHEDGWYLRQDIIWAKKNPCPESVKDRCTRAHEYVFLLSKNQKYYFDHEAAKETAVYRGRKRGGSRRRYHANNCHMDRKVYDTRNMRSVWPISVGTTNGQHIAPFPQELAKRCILLGSRPGDTILDPFAGSGTTLIVAMAHNRSSIGIEISPDYTQLIHANIQRFKNKHTPSIFDSSVVPAGHNNAPSQSN